MRWTVLFALLAPISSTASGVDGAGSQRTASPSPIPSEAVKRAIEAHVEARTRQGDGVYRIRDEREGVELELVFEHTGVVGAGSVWSVHERSRTTGGKDWFACTKFHPAHGPADRRYDLDYRVETRGEAFVVTEVVVHEDGRKVDGRWVWTPRDPLVWQAVDGDPGR